MELVELVDRTLEVLSSRLAAGRVAGWTLGRFAVAMTCADMVIGERYVRVLVSCRIKRCL